MNIRITTPLMLLLINFSLLQAGKREREEEFFGNDAKRIKSEALGEDTAQGFNDAVFYKNFIELQRLCRRGSSEDIRALLENIPDGYLFLKDRYGHTLLHNAALSDNESLQKIHMILEKATALGATESILNKRTNNEQRTPLMICLSRKNTQAARALISAESDLFLRDYYKRTLLHFAVLHRENDILKMLIEKGLSTNTSDYFGRTPLHYTCIKKGFGRINEHIAEELIHAGAQLNILDKKQKMPLFYSVKNNKYELTRLLIEHGAPIDCAGTYQVPLVTAIRSGAFDIGRLLLSLGANTELTYKYLTPLHYLLLSFQHIRPKINKNGVLADNQDYFSKFAFLESLIARGANILSLDENDVTPLEYAIRNKNLAVIKVLLFDSFLPYCSLDEEITLAYRMPNWVKKLCYRTQRNYASRLKKRNQDEYIDFLNAHIERHFLLLKKFNDLRNRRFLPENKILCSKVLEPFIRAEHFSDLPRYLQNRIQSNIRDRFAH